MGWLLHPSGLEHDLACGSAQWSVQILPALPRGSVRWDAREESTCPFLGATCNSWLPTDRCSPSGLPSSAPAVQMGTADPERAPHIFRGTFCARVYTQNSYRRCPN